MRYRNIWPIGFLAVLFSFWAFLNRDIYFDPNIYLSRDNAHSHFPSYFYISNYFKFLHQFPDWYFTKQGGIWVATLSNLLVTLLPHRLLAYVWNVFNSTHANVGYKISYLVVGQGLYFLSLYFLCRKIFSSSLWALGAVILGFFTSIGISLLHQEASFAVVCFVPLFWLFFLKTVQNGVWFVPLAALIGYAMNFYYPQIFLCYAFCLLIAWLSTGNLSKASFQEGVDKIKRNKRVVFVGSVLFLLCASPILFTYTNYWGKVGSPLRNSDELTSATTFEELQRMQSIFCTIHPENLKRYLGFTSFPPKLLDPQDSRSLYVGPMGLVCLILLVVFTIPNQRFHLVMLLMLWGFAIGMYGPFPRLVWSWLPGMKMFRQYYHFIELFNLHFFFVCLLSVKTAYEKTNFKWAKHFALTALGIWVLYQNIEWTKATLAAYRENFETTLTAESLREPVKFSPATFARELFFLQEHPVEPGVSTLKPRGLSEERYKAAWDSLGGVFSSGNGTARPFGPNELNISIDGAGFVFHPQRMPTSTNSLEILQFNDGNWQAFDESGKALSIEKGALENISIPGIVSGTKIHLKRKAPNWASLIGIAFLSLGMALIYPALIAFEFRRKERRLVLRDMPCV